MAYFDTLERLSFGGIDLPYSALTLGSSMRHHVHEYRHTPGGSIEKQGRKLYTVKIDLIFDETLNATRLAGGQPGYPNLLPGSLNAVRKLFEASTTNTLVIPTLGKIEAVIETWEEKVEVVNTRSGVRVSAGFLEDQEGTFLLDSLIIAKGTNLGDLAASGGAIAEAVKAVVPPSLFDKIMGVFSDAITLRDQLELQELILASQVEAIVNAIGEIDKTVGLFTTPESWPLLQAILNVGAAAQSLAADLGADTAPQTRSYVTPRTMAIQDVSLAIYGATDKTFDLLAANAIDDPLRIPAATTLKYLSGIA